MKILIISYYFPPLNSVASLRPYSFAKTFAEMGHNVTVLTADKPANHLDLELPTDGIELLSISSPILSRLYSLFGVNATKRPAATRTRRSLRTWLNQFRTDRGIVLLGRMPDLLDLLIRPSYRTASDQDWDLVISSYAPYFCHSVAYRLKKSNRCRFWVADFRDLWTQHHQFRGLWPFTRLERYLEQKYVHTADMITTVSSGLARELSAKTSGKPVDVVMNGFDDKEVSALDPEPVFSDGKVRLVYTGTLYRDNEGLQCLLGALVRVRKNLPNLHNQLQVVFAGADLAGLAKLVDELDLQELFHLMGPQPRDVALKLQRDGHVQLFLSSGTDADIPTGKLFEYIASGSLIWRIGRATPSTAGLIIRKTNTGLDIGNDPDVLATHIDRLISMGRKPQPSTNIMELEQYKRSQTARRFLRTVEARCNGAPATAVNSKEEFE